MHMEQYMTLRTQYELAIIMIKWQLIRFLLECILYIKYANTQQEIIFEGMTQRIRKIIDISTS